MRAIYQSKVGLTLVNIGKGFISFYVMRVDALTQQRKSALLTSQQIKLSFHAFLYVDSYRLGKSYWRHMSCAHTDIYLNFTSCYSNL